jgi:hypothetical protein
MQSVKTILGKAMQRAIAEEATLGGEEDRFRISVFGFLSAFGLRPSGFISVNSVLSCSILPRFAQAQNPCRQKEERAQKGEQCSERHPNEP